jgi:arginine decarboxylase
MIFLWDEAWFGFAHFAPSYRQRTAMDTAQRLQKKYSSESYRHKYEAFQQKLEKDDDAVWLNSSLMPDPDKVKIRVYATQSTHKKMSSLRQGSMIHVYDEEFQRKVENLFHEAYMTHTSTSPNYQILASLDVARRQGELEGFELVQKSVEMAMILRARIAKNPLLSKYFRILAPKDLIPSNYRKSGIEQYYDPEKGWNRLEESWREDEFVLDPTHITLFIGKAGIDGDTFKNRYLMDQFGIQINKTSRNTVLFMTNIGTTRSAVAFLIGVLLKIAKQFEEEQKAFNLAEQELHAQQVYSLCEDLPPLPDFSAFHPRFTPYQGIGAGDIRAAYFLAYKEEECEYMRLDGTIERAIESGKQVVSTSFIIPYPPGFPILVPGQIISKEILAFLKALDVKEIHGYRPDIGLRVFRTHVVHDNGEANEVGGETAVGNTTTDNKNLNNKKKG